MAVFLIQGQQPILTPDILTYTKVADQIIQKQVGGEYWHEWNSVRGLGVLLAFLKQYTGSHIISLKVILLLNTLLYFPAYELLASLYITTYWKRLIFTLISGMAVSFGVASWGLTDYMALASRTLAAPWIILTFWIFFRFNRQWGRYVAFPLLVLVSLLHLSAFHALGVLIATELLEWVFLRHCTIDLRIPYFVASLAISFGLLLFLESTGKSMDATNFVKWLINPVGLRTGQAKPLTAQEAKETHSGGWPHSLNPSPAQKVYVEQPFRYTPAMAWEVELQVRGWRNMPIPLVNVANMLSSFLLIAALAALGAWETRVRGMRPFDKLMLCFALGTICAALGLQTFMWILRNLRAVYPMNFEEIRSLSLLMVPALYFAYRLFDQGLSRPVGYSPTTRFRTAICVGLIAFPLFMKSLTPATKEFLLRMMTSIRIVDGKNEASLENARQALGIAHQFRYYYDTRDLARWLTTHTGPKTLVLTDRDDLLDDNVPIIGTRQQAALANPAQHPDWYKQAFLATKTAIDSGSTAKVLEAATKYGATYAVVPWADSSGIYHDRNFTVLLVSSDFAPSHK